MTPHRWRFERFEVDARERRLRVAGTSVALTARAFDLLVVLVRSAGSLVTKAELLDRAWPGLVVEENNIAAQIVHLRRVLGADLIATVPGHGYRLLALPLDIDAGPTDGAHDVHGLRVASPAPSTTTRHHALPAQRSTRAGLIGRDAEQLHLCDLLLHRPGCLTLVGPAGVGKTTLARALADTWTGRTVWLDLGTLSDDAQVMPALARTLALQAPGIDASVALGEAALVVLDNAEHVALGVLALVQLVLKAAPSTRLLTTSRAALGSPEEHVVPLRPLAIPSATMPHDEALREGAVGLLVARIEAADPALRIGAEDLPDLRELARRLDGLPLALEMAATRVPLLGLQGVRDALAQRFDLLTRGRRDAPDRHKTLHAALDWSYGLLTPAEQQLFRSLGVFHGAFSLDLAFALSVDAPRGEGKGEGHGAGPQPWALIDRLGALADQHLVVIEAVDPPRYRLLETMRVYASMRLRESREEPLVRTRLGRALRKLMRQVDEGGAAATDATANDRWRDLGLAALDPASEALGWSIRHDEPDVALGLACDLGLLALHVALDLGLLPSDTPWRSDAFDGLVACSPLTSSSAMTPAHAAAACQWKSAFALHLAIRKDGMDTKDTRQAADDALQAAEAARQASQACNELDDDLGQACALLARLDALRSIAHHTPALADERAAASTALDALLARHPDWPDALRRIARHLQACEPSITFDAQPDGLTSLRRIAPQGGVAFASLRYYLARCTHDLRAAAPVHPFEAALD